MFVILDDNLIFFLVVDSFSSRNMNCCIPLHDTMLDYCLLSCFSLVIVSMHSAPKSWKDLQSDNTCHNYGI